MNIAHIAPNYHIHLTDLVVLAVMIIATISAVLSRRERRLAKIPAARRAVLREYVAIFRAQRRAYAARIAIWRNLATMSKKGN